MVLAKDAVHMNGRVLLSAGVCLTEKHVKIFRAWGLTEARIKGVAGEEAANKSVQNINPEIVVQTELTLHKCFAHMDMRFAPVAELFRISVIRHARNLSAGEAHDSNS